MNRVGTHYKVKAASMPEVLDQTGQPVPGARVRKINFPSQAQTGPSGTECYISGPGEAEIEVSGQVISGVPLC